MAKFTIKNVAMLETENVNTTNPESFSATIFRAVSDWLSGNYTAPSYMNGFINYGISKPQIPNGVYEKDILDIAKTEEYILANVVNKTSFTGGVGREQISMKMGRHRKTVDEFLYEQDLIAYYKEVTNGGTNGIDNVIGKHIEGYNKALTISFFNALVKPSSLTPIPTINFDIKNATDEELFKFVDDIIVELLDTDTAQKLGWTRDQINIASNNKGINRLVNVSANLTKGSDGGFKLINQGNLIGEVFKGVKAYANPLCKDVNGDPIIFVYPSAGVGILYTPLTIYFGALPNTNKNYLLYAEWFDNTSDDGGTNVGNEIVGYKWVKRIEQTPIVPKAKAKKIESKKEDKVKKSTVDKKADKQQAKVKVLEDKLKKVEEVKIVNEVKVEEVKETTKQ